MKLRRRSNRVGGHSWQVDFGLVAGKRKQLSFKTEAEARRAMRTHQDLKDRHGDALLFLDPVATAEIVHCRNRLAQAGGASLSEAVEFYLAHGSLVREPIKVPDLVAAFRDSRLERNCSDRYHRQLGVSLTSLARVFPLKLAHQLSLSDIEFWLSSGGWRSKTKNNYLGDARAMFRWAQKSGYVGKDPSIALEKFKPEAHELEEIGTLTLAECGLLLTGALNEVRMMGPVVLGLFGGIRPAEVARLDWAAVHLDERTVVVGAKIAKTRRRRVVDLSENAVAWLQSAVASGLELKGSVVGKWWDGRWRLFRGKLGWDVGDSGDGLTPAARRLPRERKPAPLGRWPHDGLRHTYASMHYAMHQNETLLQAQMGHDSADMLFKHYRALKTKKEAAAFWALRPPV
jgi:integrase